MRTDNLLTASKIKERGWTDTMINRFLGEPDQRKTNPHYRSGPPMRLFALARIEATEQRPDVNEQIAKTLARRPARKAAARKAVETKTAQLLREVEEMAVEVEVLPAKEARRLAIESYNDWQFERGDSDNFAFEASCPDFLDRITVNFVRHELTEYDESLEETAGRVGVNVAVSIIREKVYGAIAAAYPHLRKECEKQVRLRKEGGFPDPQKTDERLANLGVRQVGEVWQPYRKDDPTIPLEEIWKAVPQHVLGPWMQEAITRAKEGAS